MTPSSFGVIPDLEHCKNAVEKIVDEMPEANDFFKKIVNGNVTKKSKEDFSDKLKKLLR